MTGLRTRGFPERAVRERARLGAAAAFPADAHYGHTLFGAEATADADQLDQLRITPRCSCRSGWRS